MRDYHSWKKVKKKRGKLIGILTDEMIEDIFIHQGSICKKSLKTKKTGKDEKKIYVSSRVS